MVDSQDCDRCNATIVIDNFEMGPRKWSFTTKPEEGDYESHTRTLCQACVEDMLKWIDGEYTRDNAVELPDSLATGDQFRRFASMLEDMADEMED